jgi:uncharacterized protein YjaZ
MRVFFDRLTSKEDYEFLTKEISTIFQSNFKINIEDLLSQENEILTLNDLIFADFVNVSKINNYSQIKDETTIIKVIQQNLEEYNQIHKNKISLILFKYFEFPYSQNAVFFTYTFLDSVTQFNTLLELIEY